MKTKANPFGWARLAAMAGVLLSLLAPSAPAEAFDPSGFACLVPISVAGYAGSEALGNFPVLVRLAANSPAGFDYGDCVADGSDIRFADADGNLVPHEIDTWNPSGESLVWVRVPVVTNGAAFAMHYGSNEPGAPSAEDVWSRYAVVIHGGSAATNAVAGGPAVTIGNATYVKPDMEAGRIGGGIRKSANDGTGNAVAVNVAMGTTTDSTTLENTGKFTVSGWFKRNGDGGSGGNGTHVLAASRPGWNNGNGFLLLQEQGKYISVAANNSHQWGSGSYVLANQTWGHVAFSYESGVSLKSYFNGNPDQTKSSPGNLVSSDGVWTFGSYANVGSNDSFIGDMDELRVFDGVASGDWIKAERDSVANASFLALGAVVVTDPALRISGASVVPGIRRADVSARVARAGLDGVTASIEFGWAAEGSSTTNWVSLGTGLATGAGVSAAITGLEDDAVYAYEFRASNSAGAEPVYLGGSRTGTFRTFGGSYLIPGAATGATVSRAGSDSVYTWTNGATGTFTVAQAGYAWILVAGGGGGGGRYLGGGGGGGGVVEEEAVWLEAGVYDIAVGEGGRAGDGSSNANQRGGNGGDTTVSLGGSVLWRALGGGGGGGWENHYGAAGASGGGACGRGNAPGGASTDPSQGNAGGRARQYDPQSTNRDSYSPGGGGGAGGPGGMASADHSKGAVGGSGRTSDISGAPEQYGAGGGAGATYRNSNACGAGGDGIGGHGRRNDVTYWVGDEAGRAGYGGGGGGGSTEGNGFNRQAGAPGGSGTVIVRFAAAPEGNLPDAAVVAVAPSASDPTAAEATILVRTLGGAETADLELLCGPSRDDLPLRCSAGTAAASDGLLARSFPGLEPGRTWYVAVAVRTAAGETVSRAMPVFLPATGGGSAGAGAPGLVQGRHAGSATDASAAAWSATVSTETVSGALAAHARIPVDPLTDETYTWPSAPSMFLYRGYVFLEGGRTATFGARLDDSVLLRVGGETLVATTNEPLRTVYADFVPPHTGWYSLDLRIGNAGGSAPGPDGDGTTSWSRFGLAFNRDGLHSPFPESAWTELMDPGDGSLLRTEDPGLRYADLGNYAEAQNLTVTTTVAPGTNAVHAYLCHGSSWQSDDPAAWTQRADLGEVAAANVATDLAAVQVPNWGTSNVLAAVALVHPDGTVTWSRPVTFAGTAVLAVSGASATDVSQGDELEVSFEIDGGTGPWRASLLVGTTASSLAEAASATFAEAGAHSLRATGLQPGQTYLWKVVVTDAAGAEADSGEPVSAEMPGGPAEVLNTSAGIGWTLDGTNVTLRGVLSKLGAGDNWAWLHVFQDPEYRWPGEAWRYRYDTTTNTQLRVKLDETGPWTLETHFDWDAEIGFNWVVSNSNGRQTWQTVRKPNYNDIDQRFFVGDFQTYTWKGGEGAWNDPAMWEGDGTRDGHPQAGYPVTGSYWTFPAGESVVAIPSVPGKTFRPGRFAVPAGATVTLEATPGSSNFDLWRTDYPKRDEWATVSGSLTLSGVRGRWRPVSNGGVRLNAGSTFEITDGSDVEIGWTESQDAVHAWDGRANIRFAVAKGSTLTLRGNLLMSGASEYVLDDSTIKMVPHSNADCCQTIIGLKGDGRFVFRGKHPVFQANRRFYPYQNTADVNKPQWIDFEIPEGGFAEPPLQCVSDNANRPLGYGGNADRKLHFRVPADSPAVLAGETVDQKIVAWPAGVNETCIVLDKANLPNPATDFFYYTKDANGAVDGIAVHVEGRTAGAGPLADRFRVVEAAAGAATVVFVADPGTAEGAAPATVTVSVTDPATGAAAGTSALSLSQVSGAASVTNAVTGLAGDGPYDLEVTVANALGVSFTTNFLFRPLVSWGAAEAAPSVYGDGSGVTVAQDGPYTVWTFSATNAAEIAGDVHRFAVTQAGYADILAVGGGGSGGRDGGGGAGGFTELKGVLLQPGVYEVKVGAGGIRRTDTGQRGHTGKTSFFGALAAADGGGGGGGWSGDMGRKDGGPGPSSGGASYNHNATTAVSGRGAGHPGGKAANLVGGGGGGAGAPGQDGQARGADTKNWHGSDQSGWGGNGGDGLPSWITGRTVYYAGGGGGGSRRATQIGYRGLGGKGGGGAAGGLSPWLGVDLPWARAQPGADGFGGGGGAGFGDGWIYTATRGWTETGWAGERGGNGVVIVRMRTRPTAAAPQFAVDGIEPSAGGATATWRLFDLGDGAASATVTATVARADGGSPALAFTLADAAAAATGEPQEFAFTGLRPGTAYVATFVAATAGGATSAPVAVSFETAAEDGTAPRLPGLVQTTFEGSLGTDALIDLADPATAGNARREPGPVFGTLPAAAPTATYTSPVDGAVQAYGKKIARVYQGEIWLDADQPQGIRRYMASSYAKITIANPEDAEHSVASLVFQMDNADMAMPFGVEKSGWYPIDVRVYYFNDDNSRGRNGTAGVQFIHRVCDGWKAMEDDGSGTLLRTAWTAPPVSVSGVSRTASGLAATVRHVPADGAGDTPVYAVWGAAHAGETRAAWASSKLVGTATADATVLPVSLTAQELAGATYLRFVAEPANATWWPATWSESLYLPEIAESASVPPSVAFGAELASFATSNLFSAVLVSAGSGAQGGAADLYLQWSLLPTAFDNLSGAWTGDERLLASGAAAGTTNLVLAGLRPGKTYAARLVARNAAGDEGFSEVFALSTEPEAPVVEGADWGLRQSRFTGVSAFVTSGYPAVPAGADVVEGVIMSDTTRYATSSKTGTTYDWGNEERNVGFAYAGAIFLEGGTTYTFGENIDDGVRIEIDGEAVLDNRDYTKATFSDWTCTRTGWHAFKVWLFQDYGGAGLRADRLNGHSVAWNSEGVRTLGPNPAWRGFVDPGDGSFLRPAVPRVPVVEGVAADGGALVVSVSVPAGDGACELYAVWGPANGGADEIAWAHRALVSDEIEAGATNLAFRIADASDAAVVRFYVETAAGAVAWGESAYVDLSSPAIRDGGAMHDGDRATVTALLDSVGAGNVVLSVQWADNEAMEGARSRAIATSGPGEYSAEIEVEPGATTWYRFTVLAGDGKADSTTPAPFATLAGSRLNLAVGTPTTAHRTVTFNGTLDVLGAGTTLVWVLAGADADHLEAIGDAAVLDKDGAFSIVRTLPGSGGDDETWVYRFVSTNTAPGGATWTSRSGTGTVTTRSQLAYVWKAEVLSGAWEDAANWIQPEGVEGGALGYPQNTGDTADFREIGEGPYEVTVAASHGGTFRVGNAGSDIAFRPAAGVARPTLRAPSATFAGSVLLDGVEVLVAGGSTIASGATLVLDHGACLSQYDNAQWWVGSSSGGGATVVIDNGSYWYTGHHVSLYNGTRLLVDHGSTFEHTTWGAVAVWETLPNDVVEIRNGSRVLPGHWWMNNGSGIVVSNAVFQLTDAPFYQTDEIATGTAQTPGYVEFFGDEPAFAATNHWNGSASMAVERDLASPFRYVFHVPRAGYAVAPLRVALPGARGFGSVKRGADVETTRVKIEVPADDELEFVTEPTEVPLVSTLGVRNSSGTWLTFYATNHVVFSDVPREGDYFYWTYDHSAARAPAVAGTMPDGLWLHLEARRPYDPSVADPVLLAVDDASAVVGFSFAPGRLAERAEFLYELSENGGEWTAAAVGDSTDDPVAGTRQIRLSGLKGETAYAIRVRARNYAAGAWYESAVAGPLEFSTERATPSPAVTLSPAVASNAWTVTLPWALRRVGSGRTLTSLRLYYAHSAEELADRANCRFVALDETVAPGGYETAVAPLAPGSIYYGQVVAANDGASDNAAESEVVAFATVSESFGAPAAAEDVAWTNSLWGSGANGSRDASAFDPDNLLRGNIPTLATNTWKTYSDPFSYFTTPGRATDGNRDNYLGFPWDSSATFELGGAFDISEFRVFGGWGDSRATLSTARIEYRTADGVWVEIPDSENYWGWPNGYFKAVLKSASGAPIAPGATALRYVQGENPANWGYAGWHAVYELEAAGTPAAADSAVPALALSQARFVGADALAGVLARTAAARAANVYAVAGAEHHEADLGAWEADGGAAVAAGAFAEGQGTLAVVRASIPAGARYVRFFARPVVDGEETGETVWSDSAFLDETPAGEAAPPVFAVTSFDGFGGGAARFSASLPWLGSGASSATVKARVGAAADALDRTADVAAKDGADPAFALEVPGLAPGATWFVQLFAENDLGAASPASRVFEVSTGLGATGADATETIDLGSETVWIWKGGAGGASGTGTFAVTNAGWAELLLVGGGGAGGNGYREGGEARYVGGGGGGGAGGFVHKAAIWLDAGEYEIEVGAGGAPAPDTTARGGSGGDTVLRRAGGGAEILRALGGGGGGSRYNTCTAARSGVGGDGGSGGGGAAGAWNFDNDTAEQKAGGHRYLGGKGVAGQGHRGGSGAKHYIYSGGGGGGAGAPGGEARNETRQAGSGGDGLPCSITGEEVWYAGGGGGGPGLNDWYAQGPAPGGRGGGGHGRRRGAANVADDERGADGLGGGGGGGMGGSDKNDDDRAQAMGQRGGSGVAILRFVPEGGVRPLVADVSVEPVWRGARVSGVVRSAGPSGAPVVVRISFAPADVPETVVAEGLRPGDRFSALVKGLSDQTTYAWTLRVEDGAGAPGEAEPASGTFSTPLSAYLAVSSSAGAVASSPAKGENLLAFTNRAESVTAFTVSEPGVARLLLVGGGGAGGGAAGGGGGGGGVVSEAAVWLEAGDYAVAIGAGGTMVSNWNSSPDTRAGGDTVLWRILDGGARTQELFRALGGGGGGNWDNYRTGGSGGSGGGGCGRVDGSTVYNGGGGPTADPMQGFAGGAGAGTASDCFGSGGGGGAGGPGKPGNGEFGVGGDGGPGLESDITGETQQFGAGGGAGFRFAGAGAGGDGLGGFGVRSPSTLFGNEDGRDGFGSGGGGGWWDGNYRPAIYGRRGGDGGLYLRWVAGSRSVPDVEILSIEPSRSDATGADVVLAVRNRAFGGDVSLALEYGLAPESLPLSQALDGTFGAGPAEVSLHGLRPGATYYVRAVATNERGAGRSTVFSVAIPAAGADSGAGAAGLWQTVRSAVQFDDSDSFWSRGLPETLVSGALWAYSRTSYATDTVYRTDYRWDGSVTHQLWAYRGWIFLEAGRPYVFASRYDDSIYLKIGDEVLINLKDDAKHSAFADFAAPETGWFPIDVRLGSGGWRTAHGPDGDGVDSWPSIGLAFNAAGSRTMLPESAWTKLLDPGDGSLLRAERPAGRTIWIEGASVSGGTLAVSAKAGSGDAPGRAFLVHGAGDFGTAEFGALASAATLASLGWTVVDLGAVAPSDAPAALSASVPGWGTTENAARLALVADGRTFWTEPLAYAATALPSLSAAVTDLSQGDLATVAGAVTGGSAPYAATLWIGPDAATLAVHATATLEGPGAFSIDATGLEPGASYAWRLELEDAAGVRVSTETGTFSLPAGAEIDREWRQVEADQRTLTFRGRLSRLGAGTTWAVLCIGNVPNGSDFSTLERHLVEVTETGLFELTLVRDWDEEFAYTWAVTNDNGRQGWYYGYHSRLYNWVQVQDDQDYVWKGGDGSWTDPEMWITDGSKAYDESGFPRRGSTVRLADGAPASTISFPDDGTFFAKTVVVTNGQELTLHRDTTNWTRFAWTTEIANRPSSAGSMKIGKGGKLVLSGGTWRVRNDSDRAWLLEDQNGSSSQPGAALEVRDGADLRLQSRDSNYWPGFNADYGSLFVDAASRIYSSANFFAGAPGLSVRVEGTIETADNPNGWDGRWQVGFDSLREGQDATAPLTDWTLAGSSPRIWTGGGVYASTGGGNYSGRANTTVKLMVPVGGFDRPVIAHKDQTKYAWFGGTGNGDGKAGTGKQKLILSVPADAPAALARAVTDTAVVYWPTNAANVATNAVRAPLSSANLPHPDTDYWYDTFDPATGAFTGFGVHIVGRPASRNPQVVGLRLVDIAAETAAFSFYAIPGDRSETAAFTVSIDGPGSPAVSLLSTNGTAHSGAVTAGTELRIAASGLQMGATYTLTVHGADPSNAARTCEEVLVFDALRDYGEASTSSSGATTAQLGAETVWTFTDAEHEGELVVTRPGMARVLVVGGGGSGGATDYKGDNADGNARHGAGGGGGGQVVEEELFLLPGSYRVVVGRGGPSVESTSRNGTGTWGEPGSASTFGDVVSAGGGGAGGGGGGGGGGCDYWHNNSWTHAGRDGANGGGGASGGAGGAATVAGGHAGGAGTFTISTSWTACMPGGGGGGAGEDGEPGHKDEFGFLSGGKGGDGLPSDITGVPVFYGGGGGGATAALRYRPAGGLGGRGGGGEGRWDHFASERATEASQGVDGLGGGGGGAASGNVSGAPAEFQPWKSGKGGDGVVIVRMRTRTAETPDPQLAIASRSETPGGPDLRLLVQSLGAGASSAQLLLVFDEAADYDAAAGFSRTNALRTVSATGPIDLPAHGLEPGGAYVAALVATNAAGGACTLGLGAFSTPTEKHGAADSGLSAGTWTRANVAESDINAEALSDNLLRSSRGVETMLGTKHPSEWGATVNQGGWTQDVNDGLVNRTNNRYFGIGTNKVVVFTLSEPAAIRHMRFFTGWGSGDWRRANLEGIDVRSGPNEPWTMVAGSSYMVVDTSTWGAILDFEAPGENWLARDVWQLRVRTAAAGSGASGGMYWEIEAFGADEADAPALGSKAGTGRPVEAGSALRTPEGLSAVVSVPAGSPAFDSVCAVWGAAYAGEDTNAWENVRALGAVGTDAASLALALSSAELGNAAYVRFCGFGADGSVSWSDSVYVPDLPVRDAVPPTVAYGATAAAGDSWAELIANVLYAGSLSPDGLADVSIQFTLDPDGFAEGSLATIETAAFTNGVGVGATEPVRVSGLRSARRYHARFVATNKGGQTGYGDVFSFDTAAAAGAGGAGGVPGLVQVWGPHGTGPSGGWQNFVYPSGLRTEYTVTTNAAGAILARIGSSAPFGSTWRDESGNVFTWGWNETPLAYYEGVMWMEAGRTYRFYANCWDNDRFEIDGVLQWASGSEHRTTYVPTASGYVPIKLWNWGGSGNLGCRSGWVNSFFWNTNGLETPPADGAGWNFLENVSGEDPYLFTSAPGRTVSIDEMTSVAGSVFVSASVPIGVPKGSLVAVWGAEDLGAGSDPADWPNRQSMGSAVGIDAATRSANLAVADPAATPVLRVALVGAGGEVVWSGPERLDRPDDPVIGAVSGSTDGDTLSVSGSVVSVGSGSGFALDLVWSYVADFSEAWTNAIASSGIGAFAAGADIVPGTNGWWMVVARTSDGGYDATIPAAFTTLAGSVLAPRATATVKHHTATVTATLSVLGAGVTTATIWAGDSPSNLVAVAGSAKILKGTGAFKIEGAIPGLPHHVWCKVVAVNVAPGGTRWTSETDLFEIDTLDEGVYTWRADATSGDWNDPANWEVSGVDPADCLGYPDSLQATVVFQPGTVAEIRVPAKYVFKEWSLAVKNVRLTFTGDGRDVSGLAGNLKGGDSSGSELVFDGLEVVENYDGMYIGDSDNKTVDMSVRVVNGSLFSSKGSVSLFGSNVLFEVSGGSELYFTGTTDYGLYLYGKDQRFVLDGSTAEMSRLAWSRKAFAGEQFLDIAGDSRLTVRNWARNENESEDTMASDVRFSFSVPLEGWAEIRNGSLVGGHAPLDGIYNRGSDDKKLFAYRSTTNATGRVVFSVDRKSPLVNTGRTRTVQLVSWKAGIDEKNVVLLDGALPDGTVFARLRYTYGWPSVRGEPQFEGEPPTGVCAEIRGQGASFLIFR